MTSRQPILILGRAQPAVLVEIEQPHLQHPIHKVSALLHDWRYRGWYLDGSVPKSIETFVAAIDQKVEALGVRGQRYINNFLFLASDTEYASLMRTNGAA